MLLWIIYFNELKNLIGVDLIVIVGLFIFVGGNYIILVYVLSNEKVRVLVMFLKFFV